MRTAGGVVRGRVLYPVRWGLRYQARNNVSVRGVSEMLKANVQDNGAGVRITANGTVRQTVLEIAVIAVALYNNLRPINNGLEAEIFRLALAKALAPESAIWEIKTTDGYSVVRLNDKNGGGQ